MKLVSLPYESKQLEWIFHRRCISLIVQGKNSYFPFRLGSWCGSYMGVIPVPERTKRDHLVFWAETECSKLRTSEREFAWEARRRRQAVMRKLRKPAPSRPLREKREVIPCQGHCTAPSWDLGTPGTCSGSPPFTSRETGTASLRKVLYRCFISTFPFPCNNTVSATPYRIHQCPGLLLRKQGRRF